MTLTLETPKILQLDKKKWKDAILNFIAASLTKKNAAAAARAADAAYAVARDDVRVAMRGAPIAQCGNAILQSKTTAPAKATLTLANGEIVDFAKIDYFMAGNVRIERDQIAKIFGGRSGSEDVTVSGAP